MADTTTLARFSLEVAAVDADEFARFYQERIEPLLAVHGLVAGEPCSRASPPHFFSRVFSVAAAPEIERIRSALGKEPQWRQVLLDLRARFALSDSREPFTFDIYSTSAQRARVAEAGRGTRWGLWHSFGPQDGLPSSLVTRIVRDRRGMLWIATLEGGICYYDGAFFCTYTTAEGLPHNSVFDILEDRRGDLWFTVPQGAVRYDGSTFHNYTAVDGLSDNALSETTFRNSICEDGAGRIWIYGGDSGVSCFDGVRFVQYAVADGLAANNITSMLLDKKGHLWFATQNGVSRYDGATFRKYTTADGLIGDEINAILEDRRGHLWFATQSGVSRYDGATFANYNARDGLAGNWVGRVLEDRQGRIWFGSSDAPPTYFDGVALVVHEDGGESDYPLLEDSGGQLWFNRGNSGLSRFDGKETRTITTEDGLAHDWIHCIYEDDEGFLWVGTLGGGISRYDGNCFAHFTKGDLDARRVEALSVDGTGRVWMGTWGGGLTSYDGKGLEQFRAKDGLASDALWSLCLDRGGEVLWIGTQNGLCKFDGENFRNYTVEDGLAHDSIWSICQDRHGALWLGTQGGGVSKFDGENFRNYTVADGLANDRVWSIVEGVDGALWFSCFNAGICRFDGARFRNYTTADGLAHDQVWCMWVDRSGSLWCGTWGGGVSRFDGESFCTFSRRDGMADNNVRSICEDEQGHLWFATYGGGVSRFDGRIFQTIARKDGLIHDAVQHVEQAPDGAMWVATDAGVSRYCPSRTAPRVNLQGVVADRRYAPDEEVSFSVAQHLVAFEFQGASFVTAPDQFAYTYQLGGVDADWQTTYQRRVEYRDLPQGTYTFCVRAVDRDLNYSQPASVVITIVSDMQRDRIDALEAELSQAHGLEQFIGQSAGLRTTLDQIHNVANANITVLVLGETGTGKGLAARAIHALSARREQPLIQLNCGAIPEGLIESELFGHEKGAFTGAVQRKIGRFELADGGTLFLDEIGDLPLVSQQVLLQVLQDGTFQRVGGNRTIGVDVRVVAATNRDLRAEMAAGTFREDLFFRLSAFALHLPPLRERREDVPLLLQYFIEQFARHLHRPLPQIEDAVFTHLQQYAWPGNVRELEHWAQHALLVCKDNCIRLEDMPSVESSALEPAEVGGLPTLDQERARAAKAEKALIVQALEVTNWIVSGKRGAAQLLQTHPEKLRMRMRKYGIKRPHQ